MASKEVDYRRALGKPELCTDSWLSEIEIEFEKVSEELEMDITLIFPVAERNSRSRFDLHVDVNPGSTPLGRRSSKSWRRLPPSPGPPPNRPLPPLPTAAASSRPVSVQSTSTTLRSRSNTISTTEEALASPVSMKCKLRDRFRLGRRSAIVQSS